MEPTIETFPSNRKSPPIALFLPPTPKPGPVPVVLLLHGVGGPLPPYLDDMVSFAEALAAAGIASAMPHYLEATDSTPGDGLMLQVADMHPLWRRVCGDALAMLAKDSRFDTDRTGLLGFSLGGLLALGVSVDSHAGVNVHAVVDFFAPARFLAGTADWKKLPPAQIHHGTADDLVEPDHSEWLISELERADKKAGEDFFYEVYPGQGHGFTGKELADSREKTVTFLEPRLK